MNAAAVRWDGPPAAPRGNVDAEFITLYQLAGQGVAIVPRAFAARTTVVVFDGFLGRFLRPLVSYVSETERHLLKLGMPVYRARMATIGEVLPGTSAVRSGLDRNVDYALGQIHLLLARHPHRNLVLYGHSLGGTVLLRCLEDLTGLPDEERRRIYVIADQSPDMPALLAQLITGHRALRPAVDAALRTMGGSIDLLDDVAALERLPVPDAMAPRVLRRGTHVDSRFTVFGLTRLANRRLGAVENDGWLPTSACIDPALTHVTEPGSDHLSPSWAGHRGDAATEGHLIEAMLAIVAGVRPIAPRPSAAERRRSRLRRWGRNLSGRPVDVPRLADVGPSGTGQW